MQTFTQTQAVQILDFFATTIATTLDSVRSELAEDGVVALTQVRLYDSACLAEIYARLANAYEDTLGEDTVFSFTVADVQAAIGSLDTEFRDTVYELFLQHDDDIARLVYGKTFAEYMAA